MDVNGWTRACEAGACVEVKLTRCESGNCVDVSYVTACESSSCVEVGHDGDVWLVRDSKDPDGPRLRYTPRRWAALLERIKAGEQVDVATEFFPLRFDAGEREAFLDGVRAGKFDPS